MPGKLMLAPARPTRVTYKRRALGAGAWSSTSLFLLEESAALGCSMCSSRGLALSGQVQATLGAMPLSGLDLGPVG